MTARPATLWELTCRKCGEVGYSYPLAMMRAGLRARCPECGYAPHHGKARELRNVSPGELPDWLAVAWARGEMDPEFSPGW